MVIEDERCLNARAHQLTREWLPFFERLIHLLNLAMTWVVATVIGALVRCLTALPA
jgi:hypothetical protein